MLEIVENNKIFSSLGLDNANLRVTVLIQVENNVERPIAFASKKLNNAEVN